MPPHSFPKNSELNALLVAFHEYFEVLSANTAELREQVFHLRYQVICEELKMPGYESWKYPNAQEVDEYDYRSAHCLLRHRPTGQLAGIFRLILSDPDDPTEPFPIETCASHLFYRDKIDPAKLPRHKTAEVSRFMLAKRFRNRKGDEQHIFGSDEYVANRPIPSDRRRFPHILLGLLVGLIKLCAEQQVTHCYCIIEPALGFLLRRFKFAPVPVGPVIEYHGLRQPHFGCIPDMLARVHRQRPDLWELFTDCGRIWPAPSDR